MKFRAPLVFVLPVLTIACGASDKSGAAAGGDNPCGLHTQYAGDELCIPAPSPDEGIQIHVGPANYDDPTVTAPYLIAAGDENVVSFNAPISQSGFYYLRQQNRMRPHSHHMLIFPQNDPTLQEGPASGDCNIAGAVGFIAGSQTPKRDFPDKLGPEDQGLASQLPQSNMACFQMHYINDTTEAVLREAWVNLYKEPEANVTQDLQSIFMVGDLAVAVPPHTQQTTSLSLAPQLTSDTRIFQVSAHMHAHAEHFTLWRQQVGQAYPGDVIYESFNWEDPLQNTFNSVTTNPMPNATTKTDGGLSGDFSLKPGETLNWACDVNNTTDATLNFGNYATKAEMCMLVGGYISPSPRLMSGFCMNGNCTVF